MDAFDYHDFRLKSALGRYDGNVYPAIMKAAEADMMNKHQVMHPVVAGRAASGTVNNTTVLPSRL